MMGKLIYACGTIIKNISGHPGKSAEESNVPNQESKCTISGINLGSSNNRHSFIDVSRLRKRAGLNPILSFFTPSFERFLTRHKLSRTYLRATGDYTTVDQIDSMRSLILPRGHILRIVILSVLLAMSSIAESYMLVEITSNGYITIFANTISYYLIFLVSGEFLSMINSCIMKDMVMVYDFEDSQSNISSVASCCEETDSSFYSLRQEDEELVAQNHQSLEYPGTQSFCNQVSLPTSVRETESLQEDMQSLSDKEFHSLQDYTSELPVAEDQSANISEIDNDGDQCVVEEENQSTVKQYRESSMEEEELSQLDQENQSTNPGNDTAKSEEFIDYSGYSDYLEDPELQDHAQVISGSKVCSANFRDRNWTIELDSEDDDEEAASASASGSEGEEAKGDNLVGDENQLQESNNIHEASFHDSNYTLRWRESDAKIDKYNFGKPFFSTSLIDFKEEDAGTEAAGPAWRPPPHRHNSLSPRFKSIAMVVHYHPNSTVDSIHRPSTHHYDRPNTRTADKLAHAKRRQKKREKKSYDNPNLSEEKRKFHRYMGIPFENFNYDVEFTNKRKMDPMYKELCFLHRSLQFNCYYQRESGVFWECDPAFTDPIREKEYSYDPVLAYLYHYNDLNPVRANYQFIDEHHDDE